MCTQKTPAARRLAAMPEISESDEDPTAPGADRTSVFAHVAASTGGFAGGGGGRHALSRDPDDTQGTEETEAPRPHGHDAPRRR